METTPFQIVLYTAFGLMAMAGAVIVIVSRKVVYSALGLLANFVALGALYIMLSAEFLGLVQFVVYAGAIVVLFLFALMFVGGNQPVREQLFRPLSKLIALGLGVVLLAEMAYLLLSSPITGHTGSLTPQLIKQIGNVQVLGQALFTDYLLPFELAALLLLVGIIGALVLAKSQRSAQARPEADK